MAAFRYRLFRRSIVEEVFYVEADSAEEAEEIARDTSPDPVTEETEWIDWYDDRYQAADEPEILDPLIRMIKEYELEKTNEKV